MENFIRLFIWKERVILGKNPLRGQNRNWKNTAMGNCLYWYSLQII